MQWRLPSLAVPGSIGLVFLGLGLARLEASMPKNVILFIGDGMGSGQVQAAGLYAYGSQGTLGFEQFPGKALVVTAAAGGSVTDSAAASTAMATGIKVNNGVISLAIPGDGRALTTILEYAQALGKSSGLVTTVSMVDATPAAFAAHQPSRSDTAAIAVDILEQTRPRVLLGGGASQMGGAGAAGYTVVTTAAELTALDPEGVHLLSGQFSSGSMNYVLDRTPDTTEPTLALMTGKALAILGSEPNGLFMMAEGGLIDHAGHIHDLARSIQETLSLDQAVQAAVNWVAATGHAGDTLILVTADHETGGLRVISSQGAGALPLVSWDASGHTGAQVPVYAYGLHSDWVRGTLDNTDLFRVMRGLTLSLPHAGPDLGEVIWAGSVVAGTDGTRITGLTATGIGTTLETDVIYVGSAGAGELAILDGASLTTLHGFVGYGVTDTGRVRVSGAGSLWDTRGQLIVGGDWSGAGGTGALEVSQQAMVKAREVTIWQTGELAGDGTVQADSVVNRGTLRPGTSIGTLTISGDLTFEPNSILEIEVDNAGHSDKVAVTGAAAIHGGTVKAVSTETITASQRYPILEAGDIVGVFDALDTALLSIDVNLVDANAALGYGRDAVVLTIGPTRFDDPAITRTANQRSLGQALQQIADSGGSTVTSSLQDVAGENSLRTAYDQLAGLTRPSLASLALAGMDRFVEAAGTRTRTVRAARPHGGSTGSVEAAQGAARYGDSGSVFAAGYGPLAVGRGSQVLADRPWGLWVQGIGAWAKRHGGQDRAGYRASTYGTGAGLDWTMGDAALLGVTAGATQARVDYTSLPDRSRMDACYAGAYGIAAWDRVYLDATCTYTDLRYHTDRYVGLTSEHLQGDSDGYGIIATLEAGCNAGQTHGWAWQPLVSMQMSYVDLDDERETGGASALAFGRQTQTSIKGSLGMRASRPLAMPGLGAAMLCVQGRWAHELGDRDADAAVHFVDFPAAVFSVKDEGTRDSAMTGASLVVPLGRTAALRLHYNASLSAFETIHVLGAAMQWCW